MSENAPPSVQWYDELTPAEALDVALDNYEDYLEAARRHAALGAPEGVENAVDIAHAIANVLFDSHNSLNSASIPEVLQGIDWSLGERIETEERPGEPTVVKCISRTVEAMFAKELLQKVLEGSFGRFAKLLTLVRPAEAANWTADFFRHVGRCYVYGLNAECLIMCRGVLDCEFQREVGADQCIELLGERSSGSFSLSDRVRVAQASGLISADEAEAAREVIKAANEAVHRHPGKAANADAFSMIEKTVAVLRGLHGPHDVAEDDSTEDQADF